MAGECTLIAGMLKDMRMAKPQTRQGDPDFNNYKKWGIKWDKEKTVSIFYYNSTS